MYKKEKMVPLNFRHMTIKCIQNTRKLLALYVDKRYEEEIDESNHYHNMKCALSEISKIVDKFESKTKETDYQYGIELSNTIKELSKNYNEKIRKHMNRFCSGILDPYLSEEKERNKRTNRFIFPNKKFKL